MVPELIKTRNKPHYWFQEQEKEETRRNTGKKEE